MCIQTTWDLVKMQVLILWLGRACDCTFPTFFVLDVLQSDEIAAVPWTTPWVAKSQMVVSSVLASDSQDLTHLHCHLILHPILEKKLRQSRELAELPTCLHCVHIFGLFFHYYWYTLHVPRTGWFLHLGKTSWISSLCSLSPVTLFPFILEPTLARLSLYHST